MAKPAQEGPRSPPTALEEGQVESSPGKIDLWPCKPQQGAEILLRSLGSHRRVLSCRHYPACLQMITHCVETRSEVAKAESGRL